MCAGLKAHGWQSERVSTYPSAEDNHRSSRGFRISFLDLSLCGESKTTTSGGTLDGALITSSNVTGS